MAKTITLDAADLGAGATAKLRDLTYTPSGGSATTVKALLTAAVTIPPATAHPDVTSATADGGSGSSPITYVSAVAVDATDKHKINVTTKSVAISAGGIPEGYEEETKNYVTDSGIFTRTMLVKTSTKATVETWNSADLKKILQVKLVGSDYLLRIDKGYLVT